MNDFKQIMITLREFNKARDWKQFHNQKDLAGAINVEVGITAFKVVAKEKAGDDCEESYNEIVNH